jgi:DNA end-binding protein Ku
MPQTIWIGNIHFKDINVPVKLHTTVQQNRVQFHLLHKTDRIRLRQQMICAYEKIPVLKTEELKGFQIDKRKFIIMDPEEFEQTEPESSRTIDVHEFVDPGEIDPVFMEKTYYLEPEVPGKAYGALAAALKEMNALGVCTWAMRKRSYLGALKSDGKILKLTVLRYADEIIQVQSLGIQEYSLSEKELAIAGELIGKLTVHFQPEKYINEHQKKLQAMIEKKAHGEKFVVLKPRRLKSTAPGKLLDVLEESLRKAK